MTYPLSPFEDGIPYFESLLARNTRFPTPNRNQRAQIAGTFYRWTGAVWLEDVSSTQAAQSLKWYDIRDYDAVEVSAGGTESGNSAALAAAYAAALADPTGGLVYIPPGTWDYDANWVVSVTGTTPKTVVVMGVPGASVLRPSSAVTIACTLATQVNDDGTTNGLILRGVRLDGVNTYGRTGVLVGENAGNLNGRIRLEFVEILRFGGSGGKGLYVKNTVSCTYRNVYVGRSYVNLHQEGSDPNLPTVQTYDQCEFREATTTGVLIKNGYRTKFHNGCVIEANFGAGMIAQPAINNNVTSLDLDGVWFEDNWRVDLAPLTKYALVADGSASGATCSVRVANTEFAATNKAASFVNVVNLVWDNNLVANAADQVNINAACIGDIHNWPENNSPSATSLTNLSPYVTFHGGRPMVVDGFFQDNVSASQTNVELSRNGNRFFAAQRFSITGIVAQLAAGQARTAGTLTAEVWTAAINPTTGARTETAMGLTAVINASNPVYKITTQARWLDFVAAGSELFVKVTTDGGWLPTTADLKCSIMLEG